MKHQLEDYQITENYIPIYCDNTAAICLSKNPILHSRAKHIEIKHHFIIDYVQKGVLDIQFIDTDHQWADIFQGILRGVFKNFYSSLAEEIPLKMDLD